MKPIKLMILAFLMLVPTAAFAQGYYGGGGYGPAPAQRHAGGFHKRNIAFGFSAGLGGMSDQGGDIECGNCDYNPLSFQVEGHIGGFVGPRFALMFEAQLNGQTVEQRLFSDEDVFLTQGAAMFAAQSWVTPILWLKGGIGFSHLQLEDSFNAEDIDNGTALMGAIGVELLSARDFSIDLQGRLLNGSYKGIDNNITAASVGIGINWY